MGGEKIGSRDYHSLSIRAWLGCARLAWLGLACGNLVVFLSLLFGGGEVASRKQRVKGRRLANWWQDKGTSEAMQIPNVDTPKN